MQRPTPLLPTVTTPISLWPYKNWVKGNLKGGEGKKGTETKEEPSINKEKKRGKTGGRNPANTDKRKAKNEKKRTKSTEEPREINPETRGKNKVKNQSKKKYTERRREQ